MHCEAPGFSPVNIRPERKTMTAENAMPTNATGPKTADGKRIAARNATTHGLFARDVVLTHLGEDPAGYEALHLELAADLRPANLLEKHYVEKIAAASWRLRRLHRWQAQVLEDPALSDAEALLQLDRVMRHETTLHRQIDTSVKLLGRDVPQLVEGRARRAALAYFHATEADCRHNPSTDRAIADQARRHLDALAVRPLPAVLHAHPDMLDNAPAPPPQEPQICQNEPAPAPSSPTPPELAAVGATLRGCPPVAQTVSISAIRKACKTKQHENLPKRTRVRNKPSSPRGGGEWACPPGGVLLGEVS